ncbi:phage/plasmid primase, P4 family [Gemmatimonas sp.]|uniref:phage/plasmid primase, P4 family n=1 Tax=Gemmatimonas sp. TaxID=1962908 RepID=UPI003DA48139
MSHNLPERLAKTLSPSVVAALAPIAESDAQSATADDSDLPPDVTEDGLALAFTERHAGELRHCATLQGWQVFDGVKWSRDTTRLPYSFSRLLVREVAGREGMTAKQRARLRSSATVNAVVSLASSDRVHAIGESQFDADPMVLNTPGGLVDLRTGTLRPNDARDYCTKVTAATPGGDAPRWRAFLSEVTGGDEEIIAYLHRLAGYWLTGHTTEHALVFVYGTGGNGKSVFLNAMLQMMGTYGMQAPMSLFEEKAHEGHPTELAMLRGSRLVVATETEEGRRWAESRIKVMTGGDPITARFMRGDFFTYQPHFKPVIAGNHRPGFRNPDEAIRRRLHLVPFTRTFAAPDRELTAKLQAEAGGILAWALEGCLQWQQRGLQPPEAVRVATSDYLEAQDTVGMWLAECTEEAPGQFVPNADIWASWKQWTEARGEFTGSQKRLSERLRSHGFQDTKTRQGRGFIGFRVGVSDAALGIGGHMGRDLPLSTLHARAHIHAPARARRPISEVVSHPSTASTRQVLVTWRGGEQVVLDANDRDLELMRADIAKVEPYEDAA